MKILSAIPLSILLIMSVAVFGQFNPATNSIGSLENIIATPGQKEYNAVLSNLAGVPCGQNTFFAVGGGNIVSFTLNGGTVTNNGSVATAGGGSLAFCNNMDGGSFSPTFYTNSTFTRAGYYNGTGWIRSTASPVAWIVNTGGNGNFLYFTAHDSVTHDEIGIVRYNGSSYSAIYTLSDTSRAITVADLAADDAGNVWFFIGKHADLSTDTLNVVSPAGQLLHQFPFSYNTDNAYGVFMQNGILYIGLGSSNPDHPNTLIPVSITNNTALAGTPIAMPGTTSYSDLASCNAGSPLAIRENQRNPGIRIYPNPFKDMLYITDTNPEILPFNIRICNSLGETVYQKVISNENEAIDLSGLPSGIFLLNDGNSFQKIVKH